MKIITDIANNMNKSQTHYAKGKWPDREGYILYMIPLWGILEEVML